jgi:cathepsin X
MMIKTILLIACFAVITSAAEEPLRHHHPHGGCAKSIDADTLPDLVKTPLPHTYTQASDLPATHDWRNINGTNYLTPDMNQHIPHYCGACWLHAATHALNDRLKIGRKAQWPEITLARQVVLNCGGGLAGGCHGGSDFGVYIFAHRYGLPDESCQLYSAEEFQCSAFRNCMNCDPSPDGPSVGCYSVQQYDRYFVTEYGKMNFPTVHQMKAEIYRRGPISCSIDSSIVEKGRYVIGDIVNSTIEMEYGKHGNWSWDHDIEVTGWDVDHATGEEYWLVRNSWGRYWGENGWFKVKTGANTIGIESYCHWAVIDETPIKRNWGPSDIDKLFPSAHVAPTSDKDEESILPYLDRHRYEGQNISQAESHQILLREAKEAERLKGDSVSASASSAEASSKHVPII